MTHSTVQTRVGRALQVGAAALFLQVGFAPLAGAQKLIAQEHAVASSLTGDTESGYRVGLGERATYDVEYKGRGVGTGTLEVLGREQFNGASTFHAQMRLSAGWFLAKVNDRIESWFDPRSYVSHRFSQDQRELMHSRKKNYEMSAEQGTFRETLSGEVDSLGSTEPLDDISMLFYVRTLPLKVGDVDTIPRYFKSGRAVIVKVLRKETVTVPAGTFHTIVVQPTITNAGGLFGQGGKAEVYLNDDGQRTVVKLTSSMPVLGEIALTLRDAKAGTP